MPLNDQLTQVQQQIVNEKNKGVQRDSELITKLELQEAELLHQIMTEEQNNASRLTIQQDHEERVTKSTDDFFSKIDNLIISNGMTLRDMFPDEDLYQAAAIEIKGLFQTGIDDISRQLVDVQNDLAEKNNALKTTTDLLNKERVDHAQTQQYQSNAANLLDEANKEIEQLQEQLKSATVGVKPTNTEDEQKKKAELDAKIKREKTIYNVTWQDEVKRINYVANLAATGEVITIPAPYIRAYPVIQESEVSQFRQEFGITETTVASEDIANVEQIDEQVADIVAPDLQFPDIPTATAPEVPDITTIGAVVEGQQSVEVPGETIEERLSALEAHCFGYVKGAVA